jgi:peptidoglycan-associated lipoprotein
MNKSRSVGLAIALAAMTASPLAAQRFGSVELGGFGVFTKFDDELLLDDSFGIGGRLGVFVFRNVSLEGSISFGSTEGSAGTDTYRPIYGHVIWHAPLIGRSQLLLGAGYVNQGYLGNEQFNEYEDGISGLLGLRLPLGGTNFSLRVEGLYDYMPSPGPGEQVGDTTRTSTNMSARAGISYTWRRGEAAPAPVVPVVTPQPEPQQPTPQPQQPTPQPQQPVTPPAQPAAPDRTAEVRSLIQEIIYFDFDRSDLRPEARAVLDRKVPVFQANPDMRIRISGHADSRGSDEYNVALGQRRAAAAKAYLVQQGIAADRIDIVSYGEERPAVPNATTEAQHQQNRRDEFEIIAGGPVFRMP